MINTECSFLKEPQIALMEERFNAKYVFESCIGRDGNWLNFPVAIFYTAIPHPEGSNYFGLFWKEAFMDGDTPHIAICNGINATQGEFTGVRADDGEIIYSRYRHDFRTSKDGSASVDGGRDYFRAVGKLPSSRIVKFIVVGDHPEIV